MRDRFNTIYYCNPDLTEIEEYPVQLPDWDNISATLQTMGYDDVSEDFFDYYINNPIIKDGWIYFSDDVCYPQDLSAYTGGYRMLLDGTKIEKTDKGKYTERSYFDDDQGD